MTVRVHICVHTSKDVRSGRTDCRRVISVSVFLAFAVDFQAIFQTCSQIVCIYYCSNEMWYSVLNP